MKSFQEHYKFINDIIQEKNHLAIDIHAFDGQKVGCLKPLTISALEDNEIIQKLTDWRNRSMGFFLSRFVATPERTRAWLSNVVFKDHSRLLFLIYSNVKLIGHSGFKNLTADSVELDNLIRGEAGGHPQLIYYATLNIMRWLFDTFGVQRAYGYALADNKMVLNLHRSVGLMPVELIPLVKVEHANGDIELKLGKPGTISPHGLYAQKVEITREKFYELEYKLTKGVNNAEK